MMEPHPPLTSWAMNLPMTRPLADLAREYIPKREPQKNITMWVRTADGKALLELAISFAIREPKNA